MTKSTPSKIGLLDNACHSLQRGYEMLSVGRKKKDPLALKEAIIWIHHGIELSIKQLLMQSNEFLIFDNIDEAVRKLAHLRRQPDMTKATVLDLLDIGEGIYTVGFGKLVDRAAIMLNLPELSSGEFLRDKIDALTNYRNKIVHYSVDVNLDDVIVLLADLMEPFLNLLEKKINDQTFIKNCSPLVRANAKSVSEAYRLKHKEAEDRIENLLSKFNGQEVSGNYFRVDGNIILPTFHTITKSSGPIDRGFDLIAKSDIALWLVEIKLGQSHLNSIPGHVINQLYRNRESNQQLWLIILGVDNNLSYQSFILREDVFISSQADIAELERLLNV